MNKNDKNKTSVWDLDAQSPVATDTAPATEELPKIIKRPQASKPQVDPDLLRYDTEGLMTDFPTATELQRFVYDQTGYVLSLKGRSNKFKYQVAMDVLNGGKPPAEVIGTENPYLDKVELIPEEPFKSDFPRDPEIDLAGPEVTRFGTSVFPHPDPEWRARDQKCQVVFRKYMNGTITYEVLGPVAKRAVGTKINKFGQKQPEKYVWIDPRTGEQIIRNAAGKLTPLGTRLQAFMKKQRVNKSNHWDTWIDRDFVASDNAIVDNPWAV
jgi:hypothetical protein